MSSDAEPEYVYLTLRIIHVGHPPWGRRLARLLKLMGRFGFKNEGCTTDKANEKETKQATE